MIERQVENLAPFISYMPYLKSSKSLHPLCLLLPCLFIHSVKDHLWQVELRESP
jgi:hypothetical protein